jgi:hypothetical protein
VNIHYKGEYITDGYLRKEYFADHGDDCSKATCAFVTKRAAVRVLNHIRNDKVVHTIPTADDPELLFAWASLREKTSAAEGWQYRYSRQLLDGQMFNGQVLDEGKWVHRFFNPSLPGSDHIIEIPASTDWQAPPRPYADELNALPAHA